MLRKSLLAFVVLGLLLTACGAAREWTDSTGVFTVEARLGKVLDNSVQLYTKNGIMVEVPIERLCRADQLHVQSIRRDKYPATNEALVAIDKALETKLSFDFMGTPLENVLRYVSERADIDVEMDIYERLGMGMPRLSN